MDTGNRASEKLKVLGAALITASGAHSLLCLATLPALVTSASSGFIGGTLKVLGIGWTFAGLLAGAFVAVQAFSIISGRSYRQARTAVIGTLILPLVGLVGGVSAFALLPIGALAWWLLRQPEWMAYFPDSPLFQEAAWVDQELDANEVVVEEQEVEIDPTLVAETEREVREETAVV